MEYICFECGKIYIDSSDMLCDNRNCNGSMLHPRSDAEVKTPPKDPQLKGENGLGIIAMDFSGSMDYIAFPDQLEYKFSKIQIVALALKTSIPKMKQMSNADNAYLILIGFTNTAKVLEVFKVSDIPNDSTKWDTFFTTGVENFRVENNTGTNVTSALQLMREIYDNALLGKLEKYGISNFKPMYQDIIIKGKNYKVANVRAFIYSDGQHCVGNFDNHFEGASLIPGDTNISGLTSAYLGHAEDPGFDTMLLIAGTCPRHNVKAVISVDNTKTYEYLRDLFHMTSATSGFCTECAKESKAISSGGAR